jgi:putative FmdB family regulatory protein
MPLYEFRCGACGAEFEALVRTSSQSPSCPACACTTVDRLTSLFAVSSEQTRRTNLQSARRAAAQTAKDKAVAEQETARHHGDDH